MKLLSKYVLILGILLPLSGVSQSIDFSKLEQDGEVMKLKGSAFTGSAVQTFESPSEKVVITNTYKDGKRELIEVAFTQAKMLRLSGSISEVSGDAVFESKYASGEKECSVTSNFKVNSSKQLTWHKNGQLRSNFVAANGQQVGKREIYHDNGKLSSEEYYLPEIDRRVSNTYDEKGQRISSDTTSKRPNFDQLFGADGVDILLFAFNGDSSMSLHYDGVNEFHLFRCGWFPDGRLQEVRVMKDRNAVALWNSWYPNGNPHFVMKRKFLSGKMKMTAYSEEGVQMGSGTIVNGQFNGKSVSYYESGDKSNVTRFKKGEKHGKTETWYENGQIKVRTHYVNGKLNGTNTNWTKSGVKVLSATYVNGELEGPWQSWHKNGKPSRKGTYKDNVETGNWETRDTTGLLLENVLHAPDSAYMVKTVYWQNGNPRSEQNWMNANKVGIWTQWYRDGEKLSEHTYKYNIMIAYTYWHLNGKVKSKRVSIDDGSSTFQAWHDNGQLSDEGQYDAEGRKTGEWKSWNPDGSKLATVVYEKDAIVKEEWH